MILKASQRGGGAALATHLLKPENEHVEVHEIRGFVADDLKGAMKEAYAVAKGTRCQQYLFSVSLNPPATETVSTAKFESAIERIETANGLTGQPRIIVFHEKEGRRHAHAVWSRIDADTMTARQLSHFKLKLREISKGLYLQHGWRMPPGLADYRERDPANFSLAEWQQSKRIGRDPNLMKTLVRECWAMTDTKEAFAEALERRGLSLAKGDQRDYVVVAYDGTARAIPRLIGKRTKEVTTRLGEPDSLPTAAKAREQMAAKVATRLEALMKIADAARAREMEPLEQRRQDMTERHMIERQRMTDGQRARSDAESCTRSERFRTGVAGLWDRMSGRHATTARENEREAFNSFQRDRTQRDALVSDQLKERRSLQHEIVAVRQRHSGRILYLQRDLLSQRSGADLQRTSARQSGRGRNAGRDGPGLGM